MDLKIKYAFEYKGKSYGDSVTVMDADTANPEIFRKAGELVYVQMKDYFELHDNNLSSLKEVLDLRRKKVLADALLRGIISQAEHDSYPSN